MFESVSRDRDDELWGNNMLAYIGKLSGHPLRLIGAHVVKAVRVDYADKDSRIARRMKGHKSSW